MKTTTRLFLFFLALILVTTCLSAADLWMTDYPAALKKASKENKLVLLDFTGSDWCPWCMKLDKELFSQPAFEKYAEKNLVLVLVDFPQGKKKSEQSEALKQQNQELQTKFKIEGYPTLILLDAQGKQLKSSNYLSGGPEAFVKWVGK
ncbi:MAG: thioredoxin family protein [Verrucomicrobia bacterium]|nr:thioredoxin family protein [Verrucomicrobiota bacterium]